MKASCNCSLLICNYCTLKCNYFHVYRTGGLKIIKMSLLLNLMYRFSVIPIKIPARDFVGLKNIYISKGDMEVKDLEESISCLRGRTELED